MARSAFYKALAISFFSVFSVIILPAEARAIKVGVFPAAPLVFINDGKADGLFIDLLEYFAGEAGWRVEYVNGSWSELLEKLRKGEIDVLPAVGYNKERTAYFDFSAAPVFIDSGVLFTSARFSPRTVFDLQGKRVAGVKGSVFTSGFVDYLSSFGVRCEILETEDNPGVMRAIQNRSADAGVCIYSLGSELAKDYPVVLTPINFSPLSLEYAVPKGKNADILAFIDARMSEMADKPGSAYRAIYDRWTAPARRLPAWIWLGLGAMAIAGIFLAAWVLLLRRQVAAKTKHLAMEIERERISSASLAKEKEKLSVILGSIGDGVISADTEGRITTMNVVAERICGWAREEAAGRPFGDVLRLEDVSPGGAAVLIARDGSRLDVSFASSVMRGDEGADLGIVIAFRDITKQKRLFDEIQRADKLDALGVLAGGIAHDFNNLLAGLFGYIELAKHEASGPAAAALEKAISVFGRAKALAQQLLTFASGGSPKKEAGRLAPLIAATAEFATAGSTVRCALDLSEDLRICEFDANQIGQVLDNLIINARQAMPSGGTIRIKASNAIIRPEEKKDVTPGEYVRIDVSDDGVGIPYHLQKKVFDPFFTTKETGHGLGLATCNSIVQRHLGCIDMESEPGIGTTFSIYLPASVSANREIVSDAKNADMHGSGRVLVMDDEEFIGDIVSAMLDSVGFSTVVARNGADALRLLEEMAQAGEAPKAVILDLTVPGGLGGKDIIEDLRKRFPDLPVFASSGYSEDPIMSRPSDFGFTDSIPKPFRQNQLISLLAKYLR
jgi:PAS domain S-box-containing protein